MTQNLSCGGWRPGCACPQSDFLTHNLSGAWIVHGRLPVNSNFELLQIAPRKELVRRVYAVVALNTENVQKRLIAFYVFIKLDVGALKHKPTKPVGELEVQAQQREIVRVRVASRVAEASGKRAVIHVQVLRQHTTRRSRYLCDCGRRRDQGISGRWPVPAESFIRGHPPHGG